MRDVGAGQPDRTGRGLQEAEDAACQRGLARPGFTHQAQGFARSDVEVHTGDRSDRPGPAVPTHLERLDEPADLNQPVGGLPGLHEGLRWHGEHGAAHPPGFPGSHRLGYAGGMPPGDVTGGEVVGVDTRESRGVDRQERRGIDRAALHGEGAAISEGAAGDAPGVGGHAARDRGEGPGRPMGARHRGHEPARVGVVRLGEEAWRRRRLRDTAGIEHRDPVADLRTTPRSWVMKRTLNPSSRWRRRRSSKDLGRDGDVEGCRGLIGDEEARPREERHPKHGPLQHPAGELVRIGVDDPIRVGEGDRRQHLAYAGVSGASL